MTQTPCHSNARGDVMGLVKTRRLAAMQKQQRVAGAVQNTFTSPPESAIIRGVESVSDTRKGYS